MNTNTKTISVIIPSLTAPEIVRVLETLRQQTYPLEYVEVLVVGLDTPGLVDQDELVRLLPAPPPLNAAGARNIAIEAARGELLLFIDADCQAAPDWIEQHVMRQDQGHRIVGGAVAIANRNILQLADNLSGYHDLLPWTEITPRCYLSCANMSIHRSVIEQIGLLPADLVRAHDLEWTACMRTHGLTLHFEPLALVLHDPQKRTTLAALWQHWYDDAFDTLQVRLRYATTLQTPYAARWRGMYLWASPLVALWATIKTFRHFKTIAYYGYTFPIVYLTKLIWCWSAYQVFPQVMAAICAKQSTNRS